MTTTKSTTSQSSNMKQFIDLKKKHPDALVLFRCGDFYETYGDDASAAAAILGITLTRRKNGEETVNMAGFPFSALDAYLPKLIRAGKRVAICDTIEGKPQPKEIVSPSKDEVAADINTLAEKMEKNEQAEHIKELEAKCEKLSEEVARLNAELTKTRSASHGKVKEIIKTTLLSGTTISSRLDGFYATCFNYRLDYIKLKRDAKISLNDADIQYLIQEAEENNQ